MDKAELLRLLRHHIWATDRLLLACAELSEAELKAERGGPFGSLFATLVHMMGAEVIWLSRWRGEEGAGFPSAEATGSLKNLREQWGSVQADIKNFLEVSDVNQQMRFRGYAHTLHELVLHVVDHSAFHRGQAVLMLRDANRTPPQTNLIHFLRAEQD